PSRGSPTTLPGPSVRRPAWVRNPHSAGVPAPRSSVRREPPSCASSAVRVIHGSPPGLLVLASAAAADAPDGRTALFVPPLRPALNALAVLQTTRAVGPVLVGSRRFAPFPWDLRASMKADISTLLKPDILILRRQRARRLCPYRQVQRILLRSYTAKHSHFSIFAPSHEGYSSL